MVYKGGIIIMKLLYPAIFTPCLEKPGYTVVVPDLPGCVTEGNSLAEAIEMGTDAASGWILGELEDGKAFPPPSDINKLILDTRDGFVNCLLLDIDDYAEKYGNKAIRKNITIPAWLNTYGESNNINFSKVLQEALMKMASKGNSTIE